MATALDLYIRVIQSISGYYAILNTLPAKEEKPNRNMKVVNLILEDNKYSPVTYVGQDAELDKSEKYVIYDKMPLVLAICGAIFTPIQIFIEMLISDIFSQTSLDFSQSTLSCIPCIHTSRILKNISSFCDPPNLLW